MNWLMIFLLVLIAAFGTNLLFDKSKDLWTLIKWEYNGPPGYIQCYELDKMRVNSPFNITYIEDQQSTREHRNRIAVISGFCINDTEYLLHEFPTGAINPEHLDYRYWHTDRFYVRKDIAPLIQRFSIRRFNVPKEIDPDERPKFEGNEFWTIYLGYGDKSGYGPSFDYEAIAAEIGISPHVMWQQFTNEYDACKLGVFTGYTFQTEQQAQDALDWIEAYELTQRMIE